MFRFITCCCVSTLCYLFDSATYAQNETVAKIKQPCSGVLYRTDIQYFRASQSGESPNTAVAKKIAILNAQAELVRNISALVKSVSSLYVEQNSNGVSQAMETSIRFEETTQIAAQQSLNRTRIICDELQEVQGDSQRYYRHWIGLEIRVEDVVAQLDKTLPHPLKKSIKYDSGKFKNLIYKELSEK